MIKNVERGGMIFHVCEGCNMDAHEGRAIRHSKRCSTPTAQPEIDRSRPMTRGEARTQAKADEIARLAKRGEIAKAGLSEDEIVQAVNAGIVSMSDAMNRDM